MAENRPNTGNSGGKSPKKLRVLLRTFGCQMNVRDSEVVCGLLRAMNYELTTDPADADVVIFNTCSVRQHAEDKVWSEIGRISKRSTLNLPAGQAGALRYAKPIIGIIGCMAQNYKEKIFEKAASVDFVVGPGDIDKIPGIINKLSKNRLSMLECRIWETDSPRRPEDIYHTGFYEDKEHAYVVISEGCSNYCSYCVVPYVRGELHNRNHKEILKEIEGAVDKGIGRITLLGQNVNAYLNKDIDFVKLIKLVNSVKGLREFSFVTSHPKNTSLDLFRAMAETEKLKKFLHLPVQSGSDRILKLMNRGYTRKYYLDLVDNYRKILKDATLTTDIIAGFPTETESDFLDTYNLVKDTEFDAAYIFKYSPRPHTGAARFADDVDNAEKEKRHKSILDLQRGISNKKRCLKK